MGRGMLCYGRVREQQHELGSGWRAGALQLQPLGRRVRGQARRGHRAWRWARRAGGVYGAESSGVAVGAAGDVWVGGQFGSVADFGPFTLTDTLSVSLFLARLSSTGTWLQAQMAGGPGNRETMTDLRTDAAGALYVTGYFVCQSPTCETILGSTTLRATPIYYTNAESSGDMFVGKLDRTGNWRLGRAGRCRQWAKRSAVSSVLALDGAGGAYVAGIYRQSSLRLGPFVLPNVSNAPATACASSAPANANELLSRCIRGPA